MSYNEILRHRIPEAFQDNENLDAYLEASGEVFDEFLKTIKEHDTYKDYKTIAERRLSTLLNRYGLRLSRKLPPEVLRMIVRDITTIYNTNGTYSAIEWAMKLIGISYRIEKAWLIDPHLYLPGVGDPFGDGQVSPFDLAERGFVTLNILPPDRAYIMGQDAQLWDEDSNFLIIGTPRIGPNEIVEQNAGETGDSVFDAAMREREFDFDRIDYKNFVYGDVVDDSDGAFFYGRTFNSSEQNVQKLRIIGEKYPEGAFNSEKLVVATPYIALFVDDYDFDYVEDLDGDELTFVDKVKIFEYLYDHIFINSTKASTVVLLDVINLGSRREEEVEISSDISFSVDHDNIRKESYLTVSDDFTISSEIVIPEVELFSAAQCYIDSDECTGEYIYIGEDIEIGQGVASKEIEGRIYTNDRGVSIDLNVWCIENAFRYSGLVNLNWNTIEGIQGYRVYRSSEPFDENSLPVPRVQIEDDLESSHIDIIDDNTSYYYAVGAYFGGDQSLSDVVELGVEGCHPPIEPFDVMVESGCETSIMQFSIQEYTVECGSVLNSFSISDISFECFSVMREFSITSSEVDCYSVLSEFAISDSSVSCDIQCVTHSISIGDGYEIGQVNVQSHRHSSLVADELKIGDNTFCRP